MAIQGVSPIKPVPAVITRATRGRCRCMSINSKMCWQLRYPHRKDGICQCHCHTQNQPTATAPKDGWVA